MIVFSGHSSDSFVTLAVIPSNMMMFVLSFINKNSFQSPLVNDLKYFHYALVNLIYANMRRVNLYQLLKIKGANTYLEQ